MKTAPLALAALLLAAAPLDAQRREDAGPPRSYLGITLAAAQPAGEFADNVDTGFGVDVGYLYRVDPSGALGIRIDGGFVIYGSETRRVLLSPTVGGRITAELNTANNIAYFGAGPQLMLPTGTLRPYLNATAGIGYFSTVSSLRSDYGESLFNTTNQDDWALSYGGGAGIYIPVSRGRTPVSIDLGVRYRHTGEVGYLNEGSIRDLPGGGIAYEPYVSDTDVFNFGIGVSVGIRGDRDDDRHDRDRRRGRW